MTKPTFILFIMLLAGCRPAPSANNKPDIASGASWTPPPAGTIVATDSMKVENAPDNTYFSVQMSVAEGNSGKRTEGFKYNLHATYGNAVADSRIIMPFGGERMKPLLRRGDGYNYIMGFIPGDINGDNAFHEYYRIAGDKDYIRISPLQGYQVEQ